MKKIILIFSVLLLLMASGTVNAANGDIKIMINNKELYTADKKKIKPTSKDSAM